MKLLIIFLSCQVIGLLAKDVSRTKFAFDFLRQTVRSEPNHNLIVAPLGIHLSLATLYHLAQPDVASEMQQVLGLSSKRDQVELEVNQLMSSFGNDAIRMVFKLYHARQNGLQQSQLSQTLQQKYQIPAEAVDFEQGQQVADSANAWVDQATNSMIRNLYSADDFSEDDAMMLLNAITMNATWKAPFNSKRTSKGVFKFRNGNHAIDMMHDVGVFKHCEVSGYRALEMPYTEDSDLAMLVLVPSSDESLESAVDHLDEALLETVDKQLDSLGQLDVSFPKFSITKKTEAKDILKHMGLQAVFRKDAFEANMQLSSIDQNGRIDVTEKGTTAAVVTETRFVYRTQPKEVVIDRPFFYLIRKQSTKEIMFIGHFSYFE